MPFGFPYTSLNVWFLIVGLSSYIINGYVYSNSNTHVSLKAETKPLKTSTVENRAHTSEKFNTKK